MGDYYNVNKVEQFNGDHEVHTRWMQLPASSRESDRSRLFLFVQRRRHRGQEVLPAVERVLFLLARLPHWLNRGALPLLYAMALVMSS